MFPFGSFLFSHLLIFQLRGGHPVFGIPGMCSVVPCMLRFPCVMFLCVASYRFLPVIGQRCHWVRIEAPRLCAGLVCANLLSRVVGRIGHRGGGGVELQAT